MWPYHNQAISQLFSLLAFYISDPNAPHVLYRAGNDTEASISDFPSVNRIDVVRKMVQLAPVAPMSTTPVVAGLDDNGDLYYSVWAPSATTLLNPAEGFTEWKPLYDRGVKARKVCDSQTSD